MQINLATPDKHTIQSYSKSQITVNNADYADSLIIGREAIITPWPIHTLDELTEVTLKTILALQPEVILIGHNQLRLQIPMPLVQYLASLRIGIECMSIGSACRTFNVLLSELRAVVMGILFDV